MFDTKLVMIGLSAFTISLTVGLVLLVMKG